MVYWNLRPGSSPKELGARPKNWEDLKSALVQSFGQVNEQERARMTLFQTKQVGALEDYVQAFSRLSLGVSLMDEHTRATLFVSGLESSLKAEVLKLHPLTLADAVRAARTCSDSMQFAHGITQQNTQLPVNGEDSLGHLNVAGGRPTTWRSFKRRSVRRVQCFRCNRYGHIARNCDASLPNSDRQ